MVYKTTYIHQPLEDKWLLRAWIDSHTWINTLLSMVPWAVLCSLKRGHPHLAWQMSSDILCRCFSAFCLLIALKVNKCVTALLLAITRGLQREKPACLPHYFRSQKFLLKPDTQCCSRDVRVMLLWTSWCSAVFLHLSFRELHKLFFLL